MLDLNEITAACEALTGYEHRGWTEGDAFIARARTWLPALVTELREAREKIERLQTLVPSLELLYRIHVGADSEYIEEVLALARRIEEAQTNDRT